MEGGGQVEGPVGPEHEQTCLLCKKLALCPGSDGNQGERAEQRMVSPEVHLGGSCDHSLHSGLAWAWDQRPGEAAVWR